MKLQKISGLLVILVALVLAAAPSKAATQIVSQSPAAARVSTVAGGNSYDPIVTQDDRYVLFASTADNLVVGPGGMAMPEAVPAHMNVFRRDRQTGSTVLVSVNAAGTAGGNGDSVPCAISSNGQFAFFQSAASDLINGDTNGATDIFVRDMISNVTTLVSVSTDGKVGNGASQGAAITPDGRYVAFVSAASDLVVGDSNLIPDVFVRDLQLGVTTLASVGAQTGGIGTTPPLVRGSGSESPVISADGRYVAFFSTAVGLVSNVTSVGEIYLRDLVQNTTAWVSTNAHHINSSAASANYAMSTNGQWIAYQTTGGTPSGMVFRYNAATGTSDDISTNGATVTSLDPESRKIDISADGRFVAFTLVNSSYGASVRLWDAQSGSNSLISGPSLAPLCDLPRLDQTGRYVAFTSDDLTLTTNSDGATHIYVRDTSNGVVQMADVRTNGPAPISSILTPFHMSADGSVIAFDCEDGALSINPFKFDAFLHDFNSNATEIVSTPAASLPLITPLNPSDLGVLSVSSNGQYVAFTSAADGLVSGDANLHPDVYRHDFASGSNTLVSVSALGAYSGSANSQEPSISADGRYIAFSSAATNLVPNDTNNSLDVFRRDMQTGTTILISVNSSGTGEGNSDSYTPQLSADGQRVLFLSQAKNLTSNTVASVPSVDLYWRDIQAGMTYLITSNIAAMTPDGSNVIYGAGNQVFLWNAGTLSATLIGSVTSPVGEVAISPDAHWAAYEFASPVPPGTVYAADLVGNTNWVLGSVAPTAQRHFQFSGDSRFLASLIKDNTGTNQVYLYDFLNNTNTLVSQSYDSTLGGNDACDSPAVSADGSYVAYRSASTNLVPNDTNAEPNIFLYNRLTGATALISVSQYGPWPADGRSLMPEFSGDGQTLFFESWASDLAAGDYNDASDIFAVSLEENPTNSPPSLSVTGINAGTMNVQFSANHPLSLSWNASLGVNYQVQFKDDLTDPEWLTLPGTITVVGSQGSVLDIAPGADQRFYRIISY